MPIDRCLAEAFQTVTRGRVRFNEPMRYHTTFHIGGPAEIWAEPSDAEELKRLLHVAWAANLPLTVVGGGANLLVKDEGIPGLVLHLGGASFQGFRRGGNRVAVGAGLPLEWLIRRSKEAGLSGVEFLAGVPGRVGGAVVMNAGTHDDEGSLHAMADVVQSVTVMDAQGRLKVLARDQIPFGYRSSGLSGGPGPNRAAGMDGESDLTRGAGVEMESDVSSGSGPDGRPGVNGGIILEATLELEPGSPEAIERKVKRLWAFKRATQDWSAPSAGCIFKNPPGAPAAGFLIDWAGLKGYRVGGAAISRVHANFIVNVGSARAADVLKLIEEIRFKVHRKFGIRLELEVQLVGGGIPHGDACPATVQATDRNAPQATDRNAPRATHWNVPKRHIGTSPSDRSERPPSECLRSG